MFQFFWRFQIYLFLIFNVLVFYFYNLTSYTYSRSPATQTPFLNEGTASKVCTVSGENNLFSSLDYVLFIG